MPMVGADHCGYAVRWRCEVLKEAGEAVLQLVRHACVDGVGVFDIEDLGKDVGEVAAGVGLRQEP